MAGNPARANKVRERRERIASAALDLFARQGYAQTTIDQIAEAAGVSRRTAFHHFPTKEAMLIDHFLGRREDAIRHLEERPRSEPPIVSLYRVLRAQCELGYDRAVLAQIRAVLGAEPEIVGSQLQLGIRAFQQQLVDVLEAPSIPDRSSVEIRSVTLMATGWFVTAAHVYLVENRPSLVDCFDEAVETCLRWTVEDLTADDPAARLDG